MNDDLKLRVRALALVLACTACDGIGREVVDHVPPPPVTPPAQPMSCRPMACDEPLIELALPSSVVTQLHRPQLSFCGTEHDACVLAAKAPEVDDLGCRNGLLREPRVLDGETVYCGDLTLPMAGEDGECSARIEGVVLEHSIVRVTSERACALELPGLIARDVRIELEGPVTLVIDERARIEDASFVAVRTVAGAPLLDLDLSVVARSIIGDGGAPFEGMLSARRTSLEDSSVHAEEVALESVVFLRAQVHADALDAADAVFAAAALDLGSALIAGSAFDRVEVRSCTALLIAGSEIFNAVLSGCDDAPMRLYNNTIGRSLLNGAIESDSSNIELVQLGMLGPTELLQFGGVLSKAAFCEHSGAYRLGELANATCVTCTARGALEEGACNFSEVDNVQLNSNCEPLAELEMCEGDEVLPNRPPTPERLPME